MKDYIGAVMVIAGIALLATGGLVFAYNIGVFSQIGAQPRGEISITDCPSTANPGETITIWFETTVDDSIYKGMWTISGVLDGEDIGSTQAYTYTGWKTHSISLTIPADKSTGSANLSLQGGSSEHPHSYLEADSKTITVESVGPTYYDLTVNSETGGTTSPSGTKSYEEGTDVTVTATPNSGYEFDGWSGASTSTSDTVTVTMDSNKSLTAQFSEDGDGKYYLTTEAEGMGSISAEGSSPYDEGAYIQVEADPDSGWKFDRWEEGVSGTSNPTFVTMDSDKTVRAVFVENQVETYSLSTSVYSGQGSVSVSPEKSEYESGEEVDIIAEPDEDEGYIFKEWRGDATGSSNPITVTMTSDKSVSAVFKSEQPDKVTLTIRSSPVEGGTVSMLQANEVQVTKGKEVTIQAYSNEGYKFSHWSGDVEGESKSVNIIMDSDKEVIANFTEEKGIIGLITSNIHYLLMALGSVILIGGVLKIYR